MSSAASQLASQPCLRSTVLGGMLEDLAVMHPAEAWNVLVEGDLGPSASAAPMCRAHSGGHCFSITLEFGWLLLKHGVCLPSFPQEIIKYTVCRDHKLPLYLSLRDRKSLKSGKELLFTWHTLTWVQWQYGRPPAKVLLEKCFTFVPNLPIYKAGPL